MLTIQKPQKLSIPFILYPIIFLVFSACDPPSGTEEPVDQIDQVSDSTFMSAKVSISPKAAMQLYDNYEETHGDLDDDFCFDAGTAKKSKVISFRLSKRQQKLFFKEWKNTMDSTINSNDTVRLRFRMAFGAKRKNYKKKHNPNFAPLLEIIVNEPGFTKRNVFPMQPFKSQLIENWDSLYSSHNRSYPNIPLKEAQKLIRKWESLDTSQITSALYLYDQPQSENTRVRYYTFDAIDTEKMYNYFTSLSEKSKSAYLFLHLGILDVDNTIPLRTVLHLDDNPTELDALPQGVDDLAPYFEFSKPCPPYCDDEQ